MVFGECPHCEHPFAIPSPDKTPQMGKVTCEGCGKWFWEYYSRISPQAFLPEQIEVNEDTKTVKLKEGVKLEW